MDDREYLPVSLLSQICYCPRRAGLLLNERLWSESADTAKGRAEHEHVHTERVEKRGNLVKLFEYTVFSDQFAWTGKCDCIEASYDEKGCRIPAADFPVSLFPIEYKHGVVREEEEYKVQLCAQAICLEEMFHTSIPKGALFFISAHRRLEVAIDEPLRQRKKQLAEQLGSMRENLTIPGGEYSSKCRRCSLLELCMPKVQPSAQRYLTELCSEAVGMLRDGSE